MRREFDFRPEETPSHKLMWGVIIFFIMLLLGTAIYQYKHPSTIFTKQLARFNNWLAHSKDSLPNKTIEKKTELAESDDTSSVQFEFYTALPNMQMTGAESEKAISPAKEPYSTVAQVKSNNLETPPPKKTVLPRRIAIADAANLEKELSEHLAKFKFVVQVGTFKHEKMAIRLRDNLIKKGIPAVVTYLQKNNSYRVQTEPLANKTLANNKLQQLKQLGFNGLVLQF